VACKIKMNEKKQVLRAKMSPLARLYIAVTSSDSRCGSEITDLGSWVLCRHLSVADTALQDGSWCQGPTVDVAVDACAKMKTNENISKYIVVCIITTCRAFMPAAVPRTEGLGR
jgi:hypothetical protein